MGYGVAMRTKCYTHLSADERETMSLGLSQGQSLRMLARLLVRAPSTLSREYARTTTRGHSKAKALCGISRTGGDARHRVLLH